MPIDNISRIYQKGNVQTYVFDVPSIDDDEALQSYILVNTNRTIDIVKITNFDDFFKEIKKRKVVEIIPGSKNYIKFLSSLKNYIQIYSYKMCIGEDLSDKVGLEDFNAITEHYKKELILNEKKVK